MEWETLNVRFQDTVCFIQFNRPDANNTINNLLIEEFYRALAICDEQSNIVVLEGSSEVFCFGADFQDIHTQILNGKKVDNNPQPIYDLWLKLATGPYITISHVRGKVNAGGVGFTSACDIVLADETALFSLSELLFGLFPAMVLPFLIRRVGIQKAHYLTLMTKPIPVQQAFSWGLVDAFMDKSEVLLRQHILRLKNLPKTGIERYKRYMGELNDMIYRSKSLAVSVNQEIFSDTQNLERIFQFIENGKYPWER